jgi:cyclopropane fatty-acyl-phospholipid synthase-like methyltransferase
MRGIFQFVSCDDTCYIFLMKKPETACDRNQRPILEVLKEVISGENRSLFEIGSGTGQHAIFMAPHFPDIFWTTSDVVANAKLIKENLATAKIPNIKGPFQFEIGKDEFPRVPYDLIFTANTFHIMSWKNCKTLMKALGTRLREGSQVIIYGPFNYNGAFTSESNAAFDQMLKERNPESGIRAFEDVNKNMLKNGFTLYKDFEMPANNRTLVYTRLNFMK